MVNFMNVNFISFFKNLFKKTREKIAFSTLLRIKWLELPKHPVFKKRQV